MSMNDDLYFDYLLQMGAMSPEEEKLARRQAQVDMLRTQSMQAPQAQQAGRVVVAPSWTQALAQVGQAYGAHRGQKQLDQGYADQSAKNVDYVKALRDRVAARRGAGKGSTPPIAASLPATGKRPYGEDDDLLSGMFP
jgi:hypothetical protein